MDEKREKKKKKLRERERHVCLVWWIVNVLSGKFLPWPMVPWEGAIDTVTARRKQLIAPKILHTASCAFMDAICCVVYN